MHITPDRLVALKVKYEQVYDSVRDFLTDQETNLRGGPLADDDVSQGAATVFEQNAEAAISATNLFLKELESNITQLDQAVRTYEGVENGNAAAMQQAGRR